MVTRILLDPRRDLLNGSTVSSPVIVEATPTGVREDGQTFVLPNVLTFSIATAADLLQLVPSAASFAWRLTVRNPTTNAVVQTRTVRVPDQASVNWSALPDVDPASLQVTSGNARQWDATFADLVTLIGNGGQGGGGGLNDVGIAALISTPASATATALSATYLPKPSGGTTGQALIKQADGSYAPGTITGGTTDYNALSNKPDVAGMIANAVTNLVNGAPGELDQLNELAAALGNDANFGVTVTNALATKLNALTGTSTMTNAGTLTIGVQNLIDGTSGAYTATLPTPTRVGQLLTIERVDTSTNLISIGGTVRGVASAVTLPGLGVAGESIAFFAESLTSWRILGSHKPKALLDKQFDGFGAALAVANDLATLRRSRLAPTVRVKPSRVQMITAFQSGHTGAARSGSTGTFNLNDTSDAALGTQCVSAVTNGSGGNNQLDYTGITPFDMTSNALELWLKIDAATAANLLSIDLFIGESLTVGYSLQILYGASPAAWAQPAGRWFKVTVDLTYANTFNTPTTKTAMTSFRLTAKDRGAGAAKIYYGGVGLAPKPVSRFPNGVITIGFDDGYTDQFTNGKARLDRYGFPATAYVIQDLVGTGGGTYMTLDQLHQCEDLSGWEIAAHSATVADHNAANGFNSLTETQLRANLETHKTWLLGQRFRGVDHLAYPQGFYNDSVAAIASDYFATGRTTLLGNLAEHPSVPADPMRMRCYPIDASFSATTLQGVVDKTKSERSWTQFYLHRVQNSGATGTQTSTTIWNTLVDYIATAGVPVLTLSDVINRGQVA
jgi:hypothetical protein